jgi:chemotaxis protein methyltransferase CheR
MRPAAEERSEGGAAAREFRFSAEHFRVISERIYRFSGIRLPEAKHEMVYARLARRLRALGIGSFDDYVRFLELEPAEWEHCTNALTTNVTAFYREEHHFAILAEHARAHGAEDGPYRVWSAGCSTGEEPYTIAMCLSEALPQRAFEVLATDLDTQVIAMPARACIRSPRCRSFPPSARSATSCGAPAATRAGRGCAGRSPRTWNSCA